MTVMELKGRECEWRDEVWKIEGEKGGDLRLRGRSGEVATVAKDVVELLPAETELAEAKMRGEIKKLEARLREVGKLKWEFQQDRGEREKEIQNLDVIIAKHEKTEEGVRKEIETLKKSIDQGATK